MESVLRENILTKRGFVVLVTTLARPVVLLPATALAVEKSLCSMAPNAWTSVQKESLKLPLVLARTVVLHVQAVRALRQSALHAKARRSFMTLYAKAPALPHILAQITGFVSHVVLDARPVANCRQTAPLARNPWS